MADEKDPAANSDTSPTEYTFEDVVLPHLDAAYRLARWLTGNEHDAEDMVQDASLRAIRYFRTFSGGNSRAWFLRIVRNTCYSSRRYKSQPTPDVFDEEHHSSRHEAMDPERLMLRSDNVVLIERAMKDLPKRFRELLVLRELEDFSYQELADVLGVPIGTVMSGLSRARHAFRLALTRQLSPGRSGAGTAHSRQRDEYMSDDVHRLECRLSDGD
jgi:RNA polymerase sigma-70 factor (ECF subfamily)